MKSESEIRELLKLAEKSVAFYPSDATLIPRENLGSYICCKVRLDLLREIVGESK